MATFKIAKVLAKSFFKKPATLMYPVIAREWQERTRGSIDIDADSCILCGICAKRCPTHAIETDRTTGLWTIHRMQCIQCGECAQACPKKCLSMNPKYTEPQPEKVVDEVEVPIKKAAGGAASGGELACNKDECVYCGLCAKVCPADALKVDRKEKIWEVDQDACAKCGACVDKCPKKCLSMDGAAAAPAGNADEPLTCDEDACVYCGLCAKTCPCDALEVDRKEKKWKVDEDACVKCGACIDKCPKKCLGFGAAAKADGAEKKAPAPVKTPDFDEAACIYCGRCENQCPEGAISAEMDAWTLDKEACIGCGVCTEDCPTNALKM